MEQKNAILHMQKKWHFKITTGSTTKTRANSNIAKNEFCAFAYDLKRIELLDCCNKLVFCCFLSLLLLKF